MFKLHKNNIFYYIILSIDLIVFIIIFPVYLVLIFTYFRLLQHRKYSKNYRSALFLASSGSIDDVTNKYGNLDILREQNPYNFFHYMCICFFPAKRYVQKQLDEAIVVRDFKMADTFKCISTIFYIHGLVKIANNNQVSLIRAFSPYTVGFVGRIVSWIFDVPFCVSIHEDDNKRYDLLKRGGERVILRSRLIARILRRFVYKTSDMVLAIRESLKEIAIKAGADENKVRITPHGVDLKLFSTSNKTENFKRQINQHSKSLIVSVCRHSMDNYVLDIVEIAKILLKLRNDFLFIMAGDGILHEVIKEKIVEYNLSDYVKTPGFVLRDIAIKYWQAGDIAICLMGGYSLIEAAAAGKPIVSYNVEWHYELVKNNETGYLIKEHDIEGAAEAIIKLIDNPDLAKQFGENARRLAIQNHSIEKTSKIKINCYEELINKRYIAQYERFKIKD